MERAIVNIDLLKSEIQPQPLLKKYLEHLSLDIKKMLGSEVLQDVFCPVTGEKAVSNSFQKMEMQYKVSQTLGNIYLSPRPSNETLLRFYNESFARKFWLTEFWPQTQIVRQEKIILPQLEWAQGFITQYFNEKILLLAEYLPNHWAYYISSKQIFTESDYILIDPLFDRELAGFDVRNEDIRYERDIDPLDVIFLFEALDRTVSPVDLLRKAYNSLKPGGLCFITSLLSSGFEVQMLGHNSEIFIPPERMNLLSFEGINTLIKKLNGFDLLEFSTPGVLDISNVKKHLDGTKISKFFNYIMNERQDTELLSSFQEFLQINRLGTFGRIVLRKR